ncbi:MAG: hypothetical protein JXR76_16565 [Deltaproteobacteria bacterium]|nr:hypothetical protein [Deltaproteobacteria bacterium]
MNCKMCAAPNEEGAQFCSACGTPLKDAPSAKPGVGKGGGSSAPAKTMLFNKAPQVQTTPQKIQPPPAQPQPAPSASHHSPAQRAQKSAPAKTILGAPAVQLPGQQPQHPAATASVKATPVKAQPTPAAKANPESAPLAKASEKIGVATVKPVSTSPNEAPPGAGERAKTVIGLPAANAHEIKAAVEAAKKATAQAAVNPPASQQSKKTTGSDNLAGSKAAPASAMASKDTYEPVRTPKSGTDAAPRQNDVSSKTSKRAHQAASISSHPAAAHPAAEGYDRTDSADEWPEDGSTAPKSSTGIIIMIAVAAVIIIALMAFILLKFVFPSSPSFTPQIVASQDGETLTVVLDLPDAAPGSTVQIQNQNIPVAGGKVQFLLQKKQMVIGANLVKVVLAEPDKAPREIGFPIMLRHLATNDFSKLSLPSPSVDVRFQVANGFSIKVNGTPCPLEDGVCVFNLSVDTTQAKNAKALQYAIPFELINGNGEADPGQHIISVPVTQFQLHRPAPNAVVASPEITVSGSAVKGTIVTINNHKITAGDAGFSTTVPLPKDGSNKISITAAAPDSAPNTQEIAVTRVADLAPYIEAWSKDLDSKFDFAKLSRDTTAHTGKKIHLSGRIININSARGVTAFLMYVDNGCPPGGQCGVYVAFRGETDAGLQSMVDVYGTVRGTHEVDFAGGAKKALPAIDAVYVVPIKKPGNARN